MEELSAAEQSEDLLGEVREQPGVEGGVAWSLRRTLAG